MHFWHLNTLLLMGMHQYMSPKFLQSCWEHNVRPFNRIAANWIGYLIVFSSILIQSFSSILIGTIHFNCFPCVVVKYDVSFCPNFLHWKPDHYEVMLIQIPSLTSWRMACDGICVCPPRGLLPVLFAKLITSTLLACLPLKPAPTLLTQPSIRARSH